MANYVVGDIQGCFAELERLLALVDFSPSRDKLWAVGDLVARGPESLRVLELFMALEGAAAVSLGNHDLHLLAILTGLKRAKAGDRLDAILASPRRAAIQHWLRHQPLALWDESHQVLISHAGLPPGWSPTDCLQRSDEVAEVLRGPHWQALLAGMYGNEPALWQDDLEGQPRLRHIINALTRMRFCHRDGRLELTRKGSPGGDDLLPWYALHGRLPFTIAFGHWAALEGRADHPQVRALDTGCVWGKGLTLWQMENDQRFFQPSLNSAK
ncbi:symmetrical bis(5'-nucleosyl)-tetraphosphatase [Gallaecimonas sp. GXIMD4217]|uniref:symmetrical bis(5'-nucleosyl)-tetraphosphatase n=1 Tax=Gallaecimonas sp. GXIMD4217 TaxID=3131927 RepID=UPI00311AEE4E